MKLYVPESSIYNKCYVIQNEGVIRAYDVVPSYNTNYNYRDYYAKADYTYKEGSGTWSNYSTLPTCLGSSEITNNYLYRMDITYVFLNVFIISLFGLYLPWRIFKSLFGKRFQ